MKIERLTGAYLRDFFVGMASIYMKSGDILGCESYIAVAQNWPANRVLSYDEARKALPLNNPRKEDILRRLFEREPVMSIIFDAKERVDGCSSHRPGRYHSANADYRKLRKSEIKRQQ